jgi:hypothetical protein
MGKARHCWSRSSHRLCCVRRTKQHHLQSTRSLRHFSINLYANRSRIQHHLPTRRHHPTPHRLHCRFRNCLSFYQEIHLFQNTLPIPRPRIKFRRPRFPLGLSIRRGRRRLSRLRSMATVRTCHAPDPAQRLRHAHWRVIRSRRIEQGV